MKNASLFFVWILSGAVVTAAAGRQLTGSHAPASSLPLPVAEAQKSFQVPDGFEMRLFASEPLVINPVAMTWDERGRLWVLELFEYPSGAPDGSKPRDRIRILEDVDGDGTADKVTLFADGLNLATGLLLGYGGAFVGQAPYLLHLRDTNGDDVADEREELLTGFGLHDRHELLNGFTWGPDGYLYMTQGVFTHSKVRAPVSSGRGDVIMNAAVGRYHPTKKTFEVFADGTSNPWGVDFDRYGNAFVSACVIDHLFHMAPGGLYVRQGGQPAHRYGYELIPSIVKHRHYRAAYCGVQIYQGDQYPDEYLGRVLMGNIHANAVNQDRLIPDGSSFITEPLKNFVSSSDGWFRPISEQVGPDGAVWIADWYDKYPCYQNARADPEGVDRDHGRIWRVVYVGDKKNATIRSHPENTNLQQKSSGDLVDILAHPNVWQRRMSQRILTERKDPSIKPSLVNLLRNGASLESRLAALWTLHGSGLLSESILDNVASQDEFGLRMWAARLTGERRDPSAGAINRLTGLADDPSAPVKLAVATAVRQFMSGSLTVNTPVPYNTEDLDLGDILSTLVRSSLDSQDPLIPFMIWMAAEPAIARDPSLVLNWFLQNGEETYPLSGKIIHKTMRRIWDTGDQEKIEQAVKFLYKAIDSGDRITVAALQGILKSQEGSTWKPPVSLSSLFEKLMNSDQPEILSLGRQLGAVWGDAESIKTTLSLLNDQSADANEREQAIRISRRLKTPEASAALMELVGNHNQPKLQILALSAIQTIGGNGIAEKLINAWGPFIPSVRRATLDALASRPEWTQKLLEAMQAGRIASGELPVTVVRRLINHRDDSIRKLAVSIIGRFQEQDAEIEKRIQAKKLMITESSAEINMEAGRILAETTCLVCHKLHGKGADVGPDLTGVGRSTLDALLANIINPNQIIGKGYENVEVETKDDRLISGRLIESADLYVKIASAGPKEESIPRTEIASMRTSDLSVMPEGLEQMPDEDFRNMVWYLLNPPEDNRPMNDALRRELIGESPAPPRIDEESLALWNPGWAIRSEIFKDAPTKLAEYAGSVNVLMTHPFRHQRAATLMRQIKIPEDGKQRLQFKVASGKGGKWILRVFANLKLVHKEVVETNGTSWQQIDINLSDFAGKKIELKLENYAYNLENDFGYWQDLKLVMK